ncbi:hypothetical protein [Ideonella sp.]|uniref:hypothetical protein n=1 Tax=Ideonella sp. TaxID=1929293 RepID=UPI003BB5F928
MNNSGLHALHWQPDDAPPNHCTALVIGQARSGTSLVVRLLQGMGLHCGDQPDPVTLEDQRLTQALAKRSGRWPGVQAIAQDYDRQHARWVYKHPGNNLGVLTHTALFREPRIVFIARDPVAVSTRGVLLKNGKDFPSLFYRSLWLNFRRARAVVASKRPALFLSYEKLLTQPRPTIETLGRFVGLAPDRDALDKLTALVLPSEPGYKAKWTAEATLRGYVDRADRRQVLGWISAGTESPLRYAALFINDEFVTTAPAQLMRKDVLRAQAHPTGQCGFRFQLDTEALNSRFGAQADWQMRVTDLATGTELRDSVRTLPPTA